MGHRTTIEWEYLIIPQAEHERLHDLGRDGWELVAASVSGSEPVLYLKRPRTGFRERVTIDQRESYYRTRGLTGTSASTGSDA